MSFFQGVTPRTAGFATVNYAEMRDPTLVVRTLLMFIGTAPTSTGGGVKVTTVALVSDGLELLPGLFEITSAFGTTGLSLDVTSNLSGFGKVLVAVVMFFGRVGPIT